MAVEKTELMKSLTDRLHWLSERQRLLAENVANADTPKFKPRDLAPFNDFKTSLQQAMIMPAVTQANHIHSGRPMVAGIRIVESPDQDTLPSGNGVDLESEMIKVSQTGMEYQQMINLLKKWHGMVRVALGK